MSLEYIVDLQFFESDQRPACILIQWILLMDRNFTSTGDIGLKPDSWLSRLSLV